MTSLGDVTSDVISISITLAYMVIIWIIVDKLKFLSGLLNIYKNPLYLLIIVTTIIPIYSILKRLLSGKSPLNSCNLLITQPPQTGGNKEILSPSFNTIFLSFIIVSFNLNKTFYIFGISYDILVFIKYITLNVNLSY